MSPMHFPRNNRLLVPLLLALATVVVALNAWLAFGEVDTLLRDESWVQHTWQVISQVEVVESVASDAGAGIRGFGMTGEPKYLIAMRRAQRLLPGVLDQLAALTADSVSQRPRVVELRRTVDARMALLNDGILQRQRMATDPFGLAFTVNTKAIMDHLRAVADDMEVEERRLLADRMAATHRSSVRARFSIGFASGLDFLLIVLMFQYFVHERSLRVETELIAGRLDVARSQAEESSKRVSELNATLEERVRERTAELQATNRELEAFSYSVSHDLRAPLRTIDGFSLALEEDYADAIDGAGKDYIRRVRTGVQRMGQLIDALLQLSRITRAELVPETFDLSALVDTVAHTLEEEVAGRPVEFHIERGLRANGDPKLVQVALENLLGNAIKFSSKVEHPVVRFGWDAAESAWFVQDNGAGFDMQYADRLFNAFNRLHGDKDFKGSGIGLATVARVFRRHGGRIWARSEVDRGATFWFTLR